MTPNNLNIIQSIPTESILLLGDGFCFCTPGHKVYYPFSDLGSQPMEDLIHFLKQKKQTTQHTLFLLDRPSVLVPALLYQEKNLDTYWAPFGKLPNGYEFRAVSSANGLVKMVYPHPAEMVKNLNEISKNITVVPIYVPLYDRVMEQSKNDFSKQIYVHLMQGHFDLFVTQGTRVILANRFSHQSEEDFMYYLFYVAEQLQLTAQSSKLYFLGQFDYFKAYYEGVRNFQKDIQFLDIERNSPMGIEDPTPYWYA